MKKYTDLESISNDLVGEVKFENPNCFKSMKGRIVEYIVGESLTIAFPVLEEYLNPAKNMQGGFITAAFDNVFGGLGFCETKGQPMATIDITNTFQRPIFMGDELTVTVCIKSMGKTIIHMWGEGYNKQGKLVATGTTNLLLLNYKNK